MIVKFLNLKIENFKSIENMEIEFGDTTRIRGANETGKTSVADALAWVLTGKNSLGESTFNIVPIGSEGISPAVELKIYLKRDDGNPPKKPTLKRVMKAKIGRDKQFTGEYATECYINGVKCTQRDFEAWIAENICEPEIFKLVHDVKYFTENIATKGRERPWEARRRLLTTLTGMNSDYQLASGVERFKRLMERLTEFDDATQLLSKLKADVSYTEKGLVTANAQIKALESIDIFEDDPDAEKELNKKIEELKSQRKELADKHNQKMAQFNDEAYAMGKAFAEASAAVTEISSNLGYISSKLEEEKEHSSLSDACPVCGRKYPKTKTAKKRKEYEQEVQKLTEAKNALIEDYNKAVALRDRVHTDYVNLTEKPKPERPAEIDEIEREIGELSIKIGTIKSNQAQRASFYKKLKQAYSDRDRLSAELSNLQRDTDICKDFISYKCEKVSEKVNFLFDGIEFVLWEKNKTNEDARECCKVKYHGTDYGDLSYSTRFVASLSIVMAFQKAWDIQFPIITDNAESIDFDTDYNTQMIYLIKEDEACPKCGAEVGRKQADGMWHCPKCAHHFKKSLEVISDGNM